MRTIRHQLVPLLDQDVVFTGRATEHKRHDGRIQMLLTNVKVWKADLDLCLDTCPPDARIDHLWVNGDPEAFERAEMLTMRSGGGRVSLYARSSGSVDYGITMRQSMYLDAFNDRLFDAGSSAEAVGLVGCLLDDFDTNPDESLFYGRRHSTRHWIKHFRRQHTKWTRSAAATLSRSFTATQNGPCIGLKEILQLPKAQRSLARGFA